MDPLLQADRHGDRAGTHRVPADLLVRAPRSSCPYLARLGRPVHHLARVQRDAPHRDAGRAAASTSGRTGSGSSRPGSPRSATARSAATRTAGSPGCSSPRRSRPPSSASCSTTSIERAVPRRSGLVAVMLVVGAAILWLADRWGRQTPPHRPDSRSRSRSGSASPRRWPSSRASAAPGSRSRPAAFAGLDRESRGALLVPDGDPDHRRRGALRGPQARPRRDRASRSSVAPLIVGHDRRRSSPGSSRSASCCATSGPTRSTIFVAYRLVLAAIVARLVWLGY